MRTVCWGGEGLGIPGPMSSGVLVPTLWTYPSPGRDLVLGIPIPCGQTHACENSTFPNFVGGRYKLDTGTHPKFYYVDSPLAYLSNYLFVCLSDLRICLIMRLIAV